MRFAYKRGMPWFLLFLIGLISPVVLGASPFTCYLYDSTETQYIPFQQGPEAMTEIMAESSRYKATLKWAGERKVSWRLTDKNSGEILNQSLEDSYIEPHQGYLFKEKRGAGSNYAVICRGHVEYYTERPSQRFQAFDLSFNPDLLRTDRARIHAPVLHINTHSMSEFDSQELHKTGLSQLIQKLSLAQVPTLAIGEASLGRSHYLINPEDVDIFLDSSSGAHRLMAEDTHTVIFSGGNLELCLCETFRDIIKSAPEERELNVILPLDAIYAKGDWSGQLQTVLMSEFVQGLSDDEVIHWLRKEVVGVSAKENDPRGEFFCRQHDGETLHQNFRFEVFRQFSNKTQRLGEIGTGERRVKLTLTETTWMSESFETKEGPILTLIDEFAGRDVSLRGRTVAGYENYPRPSVWWLNMHFSGGKPTSWPDPLRQWPCSGHRSKSTGTCYQKD